jgi:hypothetical protein
LDLLSERDRISDDRQALRIEACGQEDTFPHEQQVPGFGVRDPRAAAQNEPAFFGFQRTNVNRMSSVGARHLRTPGEIQKVHGVGEELGPSVTELLGRLIDLDECRKSAASA